MSSNSLQVAETAFEKRRGISNVEIRSGYAQVHVSRLAAPANEGRLRVLGAIGDGGISIDFLKITQSGLSFLVPDTAAQAVTGALSHLDVHFSIREHRCIVLVYAVNMRDEEGLTASILLESISSGVKVDHVSDMHDRMLIVVDTADAEKLKAKIEERLVNAVS